MKKIVYHSFSFTITFILLFIASHAQSEHSVARQWNEALLEAIRNDFARPTVHARNLFHTSVAMYDAWTAYEQALDPTAKTFFLGKQLGEYSCPYDGIVAPSPENLQAAREEAISYAVYRLLKHRFQHSPGRDTSYHYFDSLFVHLGYDTTYTSVSYQTGRPADLGNYLAQELIAFGLQDGAFEEDGYENQFYRPVNPPMAPTIPGNAFLRDPNRWQPLTFDVFVDQAGNPIPGGSPPFLSPEWGTVVPFALTEEDLTVYSRFGDDYWVYHDPGAPPYMELPDAGGNSAEYEWNFSLVSVWASHLDPNDGIMWDISPASIGNVDTADYPRTIEGLRDFYKLEQGGDLSRGHEINPITNEPYGHQIVPRGDYTRVLAEFWADGPDSETPPGHWFTILNYVNDHSEFKRKFKGEGPILDKLQWDVKAYFIMGGTVHDAAVAAWGIKGWYDYIRPVSAIRAMAARGQSSSSGLANYDPTGIRIKPGFIEEVREGDVLAGANNEHLGKIKLRSWKGPDFIEEPETDMAGVGWILAENWWPYQRPTFVTPPFAGYVSGHSTYSRAAAEAMTALTGSEFFPGGVGEFICEKNEFLVFEEGPSVDLTLQWATYRDASDQCSLSRIWGGIHPPADDIPGRLIGEKIGKASFKLAESFFGENVTNIHAPESTIRLSIYPNPTTVNELLQLDLTLEKTEKIKLQILNLQGQIIYQEDFHLLAGKQKIMFSKPLPSAGIYLIKLNGASWDVSRKLIVE